MQTGVMGVKCEKASVVNDEIILQGEFGGKVKLTFQKQDNLEAERNILDTLLMSYEERFTKNGDNLTQILK